MAGLAILIPLTTGASVAMAANGTATPTTSANTVPGGTSLPTGTDKEWVGAGTVGDALKPGQSLTLSVTGTYEHPKFTGGLEGPACAPDRCFDFEVTEVQGKGTAESPNTVVAKFTSKSNEPLGVWFKAESTH